MEIISMIGVSLYSIIIGGVIYVLICLLVNLIFNDFLPMKWRYNMNKKRFKNKCSPIYKIVRWGNFYLIEKWELMETSYSGGLDIFTPFSWVLCEFQYQEIETSKRKYTLEEVNQLDSLANEWERIEQEKQQKVAAEEDKNSHINLLNKKFDENYE